MLQDRVNELKSGILNIKGNKAYVTGFMSEEMLQLHLTKGPKNWSSMGLYDNEDLKFHNIKNNALFIVKKNGTEVGRYQYKPVFRDAIQYKDEDGKSLSLTINIRKSQYSAHYHLLTTKESLLFSDKDGLDSHLLEKFGVKYSY
ncbi:hypothetical protein CIL03_10065 [Virgibacillus indicus]|uniref:Uncharacterized protein n=1 Tax=Virgibacillus indicus TaxID=2024554 RepID=A0A265N9Z2_9BACI|nr:hypothetical protein [Virgibacillus indicus]OZU88631.1 hypothetical protein CIL03_10065 [Virgibacillus indicus]